MSNYEIWKLRIGAGLVRDLESSWMAVMPVFPITINRPKADSLYCHYIEGGGRKILYDCGRAGMSTLAVQFTAGGTVPATNLDGFGGGGPEELRLILEEQMGVSPDEIDCVVASHLHSAWNWNLEIFPNAQVIVHRQEITAAWDTQPSHRFGVSTEHLIKVLTRQEPEHLLIVDGDYEIAPGLAAIHTSGHTPGFLSLLVQTSKGKAGLLGETGYSYAHLYPGDPRILGPGVDQPLPLEFARGTYMAFGHDWDPAAEVASIERMRALADLLVPTCDNASPKMMPEQWWDVPSLEYQRYVREAYQEYVPGIYPDVSHLLERRSTKTSRKKKQK